MCRCASILTIAYLSYVESVVTDQHLGGYLEMNNDERYSDPEATKYLRLAEGTLAIWRCTKRYPIPYIKVGSRVFYWKRDLDAFLESQTVRDGV